MNYETKPIAESKNFIVLEKYEKIDQVNEPYQNEYNLERAFIKDLEALGYEYAKEIKNHDTLLKNLRVQIEKLNSVNFSDGEWQRFLEEFLDKPGDGIVEKTRKVHDDYIYDFVFDDGHIENIYLFDKKNLAKNSLQVIRQFEQNSNRYDVTILVNGLPLVQIELKKRGVAIREAFNQIHRYSKESFNKENSLFKYLQIFIISNGADTRYFANTTKRDKNSFDFTMNWARADNSPIKDIKDFTATFMQKHTLLSVLLKYSVFDVNNTLLIMRPYQIAATERVLWKIKSAYNTKKQGKLEAFGYIWHTTGSGKTLTSFKTARLATELPFIKKVFFVVDRKDLDYQTMKEYQRFSPDSVNGSANTAGLKRNILKEDNKIIVTTIQKLNNLLKSENSLDIYKQDVVFIFDEAHRSQFGEAQKNLKKRFKNYYQFGFTGTPIFDENALGAETTASVFGTQLHSYVITDAIRDEKVLKFKVDYNDVRPEFKSIEQEIDLDKLSAYETKQAFLHPKRIEEISKYILQNFAKKTHRLIATAKGFNAMFAVSSVDAAKLYYETLQKLQNSNEHKLKIATIYSFAQNETQDAIGEIEDESFEPTALNSSAKEFLAKAVDDYNKMFGTSFGLDSKSFESYYKDLAKRVKSGDVDLLIVVGMFLTGFDAPKLNTLFVDKNLRYHGLIQAYSRTNRIYDATKSFGNIVTFRDLERATVDALKLFGKSNTKEVILEKSFDEYMQGFRDIISGELKRGFKEVATELKSKFGSIDKIEKESDKKEFVKLFGEYLKLENILQNFDEFNAVLEIKELDIKDENTIEEFKKSHYLDEIEFEKLKDIAQIIPTIREIQDYKSAYNDIREWLRREKEAKNQENLSVNWNDVIFEVELLKSQEINVDYILELIYEQNKKTLDKDILKEEVKRVIRSSLENRAKEELLFKFIDSFDLNSFEDKASLIDGFFEFAKQQMQQEAHELIEEEKLNTEATKRYISISLKRGYASENGTELNEILPKMSPLNPKYLPTKKRVFEKIAHFVEKFRGISNEC